MDKNQEKHLLHKSNHPLNEKGRVPTADAKADGVAVKSGVGPVLGGGHKHKELEIELGLKNQERKRGKKSVGQEFEEYKNAAIKDDSPKVLSGLEHHIKEFKSGK